MTKQEIVQQICKKTCCTPTDVSRMVDEVNAALAGAFERGESVYFRGFGTYQVVTRKAKAARNIARGTSITVPEHKAVKFKLSKQVNIKQ